MIEMAISTFIPALWSARLLAHLDKNLVLGNLVNRDYEGEIKNLGDRVKINQIADVTIKDYKKGTDLVYDDTDGTPTELVIDQQKYFALKVNDVDAAQANIDLMDRSLERASYALRDVIDQRVAGHAKEADSTLTVKDMYDPEQAYDSIVKLGTTLDENNVTRAGRWLVIPPWLYGLLQKDKRFVGTGSAAAESRLTTGNVGSAAGFQIYESNNLAYVKSTNTTSVMAGTNAAISMATQIIKTESLRLEKDFSDAVRGLLVYGSLVVQPKALVTLNTNPKAETVAP